MSLLMVITSLDSKKKANKLAKKIVKDRLAACVNISSPITSHYVWNKKQEKAQEYLILIKTVPENYDALKVFLKNNHPYELPEIVSIQPQNCSQQYLDWVIRQAKTVS